MTTTKQEQHRPQIGLAHARLLFEIATQINSDALSRWTVITTLRYIIERAWLKIFPDRELPAEIKAMHKPYYKDLNLDL
jgi:hypothetical protein